MFFLKNVRRKLRHNIMALERRDALLMREMLFHHPPKTLDEAILMKKIDKRVKEMR